MQATFKEPIYEAGLTEFLREDAPFIPRIASPFFEDPSSNASIISLDAGKNSLLRWQRAIDAARGEAKQIVWEMEFDQLNSFDHLTPMDRATMQRAAAEFTEKLYSEFAEKSFGVILGRFSPDSFRDIDRFSKILHEVGAFFPEELIVFALVDVSLISSPSELASLFSRERFAHIHLGFKGACLPLFGLNWEYGKAYGGGIDTKDILTSTAKIGICLPNEEGLTFVKESFDALCRKLDQQGTSYRIFPESLFTESWHGLDKIAVFREAMDAITALRKCRGFTITGGEIVDAEEIIRDRGI